LLHTGYSGKTEHNGSKFVKHIPCESCGSSDACALFDDGHMFCFSCRQYFKGDKAYIEETDMPLDTVSYKQPTAKGHVSAITDRGITKDERYGREVWCTCRT
jgi:twinkle protein